MNKGLLMNKVRLSILLLIAVSIAMLPMSAGAEPAATAEAATILDHLRDRDQTLERLARRMAHPQGAPVDGEELRRFTESLERLDLWIGPQAEDHPELMAKHQALLERAHQLLDASTRSRTENANLAELDGSIRQLKLEDEAFVSAGASPRDAARSVCEAAPRMGVGTRGLPGLDGSRDALVRFVAPTDGRFLVDTEGSRTDTRLQILAGCGSADAAILAEGDDESSLRAQTQFSARKGETVWVRVGADREGYVRLSMEQLMEGVGTASISGTVTALASGSPIEGLAVRAEVGFSTYYATTDASGNYEFSGIPAGTYEVFTRDFSQTWINERWEDIECGLGSSACSGVDGDPILVAEGQTVQNVDFVLSRPAVVSGRVVDELSGEPIEDVEIRMSTSTGSNRYDYTDENGRFRFTGVEGGTRFFLASVYSYEDELYDGIDCASGCDITTGTPVEVMNDTTITGIDFDLLHSPGIGGTVTSATNGDPIGFELIRVYDDQLSYLGGGYADAQGKFFAQVPGPGTYYAATDFSFSGWVDQMWQGIDCQQGFCNLNLATPIVVSGDNEEVEISFELTALGNFEGNVSATDMGDLGNFSVNIAVYDASGNWVDSAYVNSSGDYDVNRLVPGDYFATASQAEFRSEVYDDIPCAAGNICDPLLGNEISVVGGMTTSNVDFVLDRLGIIRGRVEGTGGAAIEGIRVEASPSGGSFGGLEGGVISAYTDEDGDFELVALEPGSYNVYTESNGYLDEAYDDFPCDGGCDLSLAADVNVPGVGSVVNGIDFSLERKAWIQGSMIDPTTGFGISGNVRLLDLAGIQITTAFVSSGEFLFSGLDDGSYYLLTSASSDVFLNELHDEVLCEYTFPGVTCDLMTGTQVSVSVDNGAEVNFELERGGTIQGTVHDVFGNSIYGGTAYALDAMGNVVASDGIAYDYSITGLLPGDYYVVTRFTDHQDELWPNQLCYGEPFPSCNLMDGTPVSVGLGDTATSVDFVLGELGTIAGTVVDMETGEVVADSSVRLYNSSGSQIDTSFSPTFLLPEIPPGTYYLRTSSTDLHIDAVYGGELCNPNCDPTAGTPIVIGLGDVVSGIEIPIPKGPGIKGRVFDGPTGTALPGVSIDLWNSSGDHVRSAITDSDGEYSLVGLSGTYFISTYNTDGLEDFLFDGIPCPDGSAWEGLCDPTEGTPYVIEEYSPLQRLDLPFGDPTILTDGFESGDTTAWSLTVGD